MLSQSLPAMGDGAGLRLVTIRLVQEQRAGPDLSTKTRRA